MFKNELLDRFHALPFQKDVIGLGYEDSDMTYFCTPIGAEIIGWLGVDGIHFCFIPSISYDMVFVVSPIPCGQHFVEPIAWNFKDFLSLVIFCKDASPLEQICWMSEEQFTELIKSEIENSCLAKDSLLTALAKEFETEAHTNPYQYVKDLQASFDYQSILFSK